MKAHVSAIALGVKDLERSKRFYGDGLGWPVAVDQGGWVSFAPSDGSSPIGMYAREALAADAGVDADGEGFSGVTFSYVVSSDERVDAVLAEAETAGGTIVKPADDAPWGGYSGHFADPDGYLWKVVTGADGQPVAE